MTRDKDTESPRHIATEQEPKAVETATKSRLRRKLKLRSRQ